MGSSLDMYVAARLITLNILSRPTHEHDLMVYRESMELLKPSTCPQATEMGAHREKAHEYIVTHQGSGVSSTYISSELHFSRNPRYPSHLREIRDSRSGPEITEIFKKSKITEIFEKSVMSEVSDISVILEVSEISEK